MSDGVTLNFVSDDVMGGEFLQAADSFTNIENLVDQAIENAGGEPIARLVIAAHGAENTHGFAAFDVNTAGAEVIAGSSVGTTHINETIGEQLQRLDGHWAEEAIIEMRVCEFGTEAAGSAAMQALADAAGVPVTAPIDEISSLALVGGLTTNWKTVYPSSWGRPMDIGFWRGEPTAGPAVPMPATAVTAVPVTEPADEPTQETAKPEPQQAEGSGGGMSTGAKIGLGGLAAAAIALGILFTAGGEAPDDLDTGAPPIESDSPSEVVDTPTGDAPDEPSGEAVDPCAGPMGCTDYGSPVEVAGSLVWAADSSCDASPEGGEVTVRTGGSGLGIFISGAGGCDIGEGAVTCPGVRERGTSESSGVITVLGSSLEATEVTDSGFSGTYQEWRAPQNSDGTPDLSNATCTSGGSFDYTATSGWLDALNSPRSDTALITVGIPSCSARMTDDGVQVFWGLDITAATPDPAQSFSIAHSTRLNGWVSGSTQIFGGFPPIDPTFDPTGVTFMDDDGNMQTVPGAVYVEMLKGELADAIRAQLGDDTDAEGMIEENGLDPWDLQGSLDALGLEPHSMRVVGEHTISPEDGPDAQAALTGVDADTLVDMQLSVLVGVIGAFTTSVICPWQ